MRRFDGHDRPVNALVFLAGGQGLASGGKDGAVQYIDLQTDSRRRLALTGTAAQPFGRALAVHPSGMVLAIGTTDGVILWDTQADTARRLSTAIPIGVASLAYLNRGRLLAVGLGDAIDPSVPGQLVLLGENGSVVESIPFSTSVVALAAEPDGKRVAWGAGDRRIHRWNVTSPDRRATPAQARPARTIAMNPAGTRIAASDDYAIHSYDTATMQRLGTLRGHTGRVDSVAFTADGRLLSAAADRTVRIWDVDAGRELNAHDWDLGNVRAVAVSPDGLLAAAAGDRGTIVIWDLDG